MIYDFDDEENVDYVEELIRSGLSSLRAAYSIYWPFAYCAEQDVDGNLKCSNNWNRLPENNLVLHIGKSFSNGGFECFQESPYLVAKPENKQSRYSTEHLDLLAMHMPRKLVVALEAKSDFSFIVPTDIINDYVRLSDVKLLGPGVSDNTNPFEPGKPRTVLGVNVCYCTGEAVANWWVDNDGKDKPKGKRSRDWPKLEEHLQRAIKKDKFLLIDKNKKDPSVKRDDEKWRNVWALYMISKVNLTIQNSYI